MYIYVCEIHFRESIGNKNILCSTTSGLDKISNLENKFNKLLGSHPETDL